MPLTIDNIIQSNTGNFSATSGNATLGTATEAGSMVVLCATILGADATFAWTLEPPTGFVPASGTDPDGQTANKPYIFVKKNTSGETSWTLEPRRDESTGFARDVVWAVFEVTGTGTDRDGAFIGNTFPSNPGINPVQWGLVNVGNAVTGTESAVASRTTGSTYASPCYDNLGIAVWGVTSADTTVPTISGYTNGFTEIAQVSRVGASRAMVMAVAVASSINIGTMESTASISPSSAAYATCVQLLADGARYAPDIAVFTGFGFGTATGIASGSTLLPGTAPFDAVTGSPAIVTTNPRSGAYCAELSSTSAAEHLTWGYASGGVLAYTEPTSLFAVVARLNVYFPTALPSGDVELCDIIPSGTAGMTLWYRSASQKLAIKVGTAADVLSDATVSADQWIGVDFRYDPRYTNHLVDWQVDYNSATTDTTGPVAQTQAVGSGTTRIESDGVNPLAFRLGWASSRTATVRYADVFLSKVWGCYPIGDMRTTLVKPDQTGTPTISGTVGNFRNFTGGPAGTLTAWSATTTRSALDEVPPQFGSGVGDGLLQTAAAGSDYCEIPMETFTAAPDFVLRAVRWYAAGVAASTASCTMGMQFLDTAGMVDEILVGFHGFDATNLRWLCRMHRTWDQFYQITQARMDGLKAQVGRAGDATPDVGIGALYAEVGYQPVQTIPVFGEPGGSLRVEAAVDELSGGIQALHAYTPVGQSATVTWYTAAGTPTATSVPAASNPHTITVSAGDIPSAPRVEMVPD